MTTQRIDWQSVQMVFVKAAACPACYATKPIIVRTDQGGDGSRSRRCICRECSAAFLLVIEVPEFGSLESDPGKLRTNQGDHT